MSRAKRQHAALRARRLFLISILVLVAIGLWAAQRAAQAGRGPGWFNQLFAPPESALRVGLVAGHRGNDSGAVCPDGLTEAAVNLRIAELAAGALRSQGIRVEILDEFDRGLRRYRADALVSIHADSCSADLSGFKVAAPATGAADSNRLAACLWEHYAAETGLPRNPDTITDDMLHYHAFREIAPSTPAAIIETGFLGGDRAFLTEHADLAAAGIVRGLICFLQQE